MKELTELVPAIAPNTMALIHIYKNYVAINRRACSLLALTRNNQFIKFLSENNEHKSLYVRHTESPSGYRVTMRRDATIARINSRPLCEQLSNILDGYGSYRVCEEKFIYDEQAHALSYMIDPHRYEG